MMHSCEVKKWRIWVEADLFSLPKLAMTAWHNFRTGKMTCWYLDKAEGINVSSIGSKVIEAAEASGRALKTLISANFTIRLDSKSISDPVAVDANLVSNAILVS